MRALVPFVAATLLPATATHARADPAARAAASASVGVGVTGSALDGYERVQGFVDGGLALRGGWLWLRAQLGAGTLDDTEAAPPWSHRVASAQLGVEARGCVGFACAVGGLGAGGLADLGDGHVDPLLDAHVGLELDLPATRAALRITVGVDPGPTASAGLVVRL